MVGLFDNGCCVDIASLYIRRVEREVLQKELAAWVAKLSTPLVDDGRCFFCGEKNAHTLDCAWLRARELYG